METTTLRTERLLLRPFTAEDADAVHAACQDADIQRWTTVPSPYRRADAAAFTGVTCPNDWAKDTSYAFGVFAAGEIAAGGAEGPLVGSMGLAVRAAGLLELGYWTAREQRGAGRTREAALAVCRWGFETLRARRIEWRALVDNTASRAVAERVGFRVEGTLRNADAHRGRVVDLCIAGLIPDDLGLPPATA